ncbi:hypothetical protein NEOLEDRAFT_1073641 [Neolentinus lepideus HHB14362 ss-1]|uniref:GATA-type domain-containing protein n=1 Tax=Neolentinus lepideus HHB14362 ss-1 TaxID=1314782 RepID=A0A165PQ60_9AGAM|nr:hypothetical protein NEOLEDRAFT_1073641 [Neolentinus lepideus HHB14362 ss-1]
MPSTLNLKFKGHKSFVAFSNLSDADALTKTWKVCTKVASYLEQGQRLENLSWRLWHLQNLIVDSDNAKSKREFRKLSKHMGDKLDKEKGRSIEELSAPGFRRNQSTDLIQQRAVEKERQREATQNAKPGVIKRMQFTFSVDPPSSGATSTPVKKPDYKPSAEFRDNSGRRARARAAAQNHDTNADRDTQIMESKKNDTQEQDTSSPHCLRFPTLFSNDFGPAALLYPTPTLSTSLNYGEGVNQNQHSSDSFSIARPTIELALDDFLNGVDHSDSPGSWSGASQADGTTQSGAQDVTMSNAIEQQMKTDDDIIMTSMNLSLPLHSHSTEQLPQTVVPSKIGPNSGPEMASSPTRPSLTIKTQSVSHSSGNNRSSGPSATATSPAVLKNNNSAPGGVKAECSNCGATHTPLWRRGLNDELNCNACGLYCKLHKRPRPKGMRNNHGEGRSQAAPRQDAQEIIAQCYNCHTTATPLWRKDDEGKTVCNACGLYYKLHGSARPISMKSDVIRKRSRHDARRVGTSVSDSPPSASPGASRRASPSAEPTLAPDSTTQISYSNEYEYQGHTPSELMGALGQESNQGHHFTLQGTYTSAYTYAVYPGPYHPDYISKKNQHFASDPFSFGSGDTSDGESTGTESRSSKRRRMSDGSATEPPSSATSYTSFADSFGGSQQSHSPLSFPTRPLNFDYGSFSYGVMRGSGNSMFWHPPMMPPDGSPQMIHPPMLPPDESPMDYLHPPMLAPDDDSLFRDYLHPPMSLPDDHNSSSMGSLQAHPPMLPQEWINQDYYQSNGSGNDNAMQTY